MNYGGRCEMWCDRCGILPFQTWCDVECEMPQNQCDVECGVLACGMLRNARCEKLRCDVKCGGVELW